MILWRLDVILVTVQFNECSYGIKGSFMKLMINKSRAYILTLVQSKEVA